MKRQILFALLTAIAGLAVGCGSDRRSGGGIISRCQNGDTRQCTCPDNTMSSQVCTNGSFGACACNATVDSGVNNNDNDGSTSDDASQTNDSGQPPQDGGGPNDTGVPADSGAPPDAGIGDAGSNIGQSCTVQPDSCAPASVCTQEPGMEVTTCRAPGFAQMNQACNVLSNNCAVGQGTCVDLGFGPRCYRGCDGMVACPNMGDICWLVGEMWGVCDLYQLCDPRMPACPSDRVCTLAQSDGTCACAAAGTAQRGQTCGFGAMNCAPGQGLCLNVGDGPLCYQVCDPATGTPACLTGTCTALTGIEWGICY